jgi:hypothetical protein
MELAWSQVFVVLVFCVLVVQWLRLTQVNVSSMHVRAWNNFCVSYLLALMDLFWSEVFAGSVF